VTTGFRDCHSSFSLRPEIHCTCLYQKASMTLKCSVAHFRRHRFPGSFRILRHF
jgi:hypothetical protein